MSKASILAEFKRLCRPVFMEARDLTPAESARIDELQAQLDAADSQSSLFSRTGTTLFAHARPSVVAQLRQQKRLSLGDEMRQRRAALLQHMQEG